MTIKEILNALDEAKPELRVIFSFCRCIPTTVDSWRGSYSEPAIGWEPTGYSGNRPAIQYPTVETFKKELKDSLDKIYGGWKGGEYSYDEDSILHVDNSGDCTNTEITRVEIGDFEVILHTKK